MTADKALAIAKTIITIKVKLPLSGEILSQTLLITEKQQSIAALINEQI